MKLPTPPEIAEAPELASLATVHAVLELMDRALIAAHPELVGRGEHHLRDSSPMLDLAWELCVLQTEMRGVIELYAARLERLAEDEAAALDDVEF